MSRQPIKEEPTESRLPADRSSYVDDWWVDEAPSEAPHLLPSPPPLRAPDIEPAGSEDGLGAMPAGPEVSRELQTMLLRSAAVVASRDSSKADAHQLNVLNHKLISTDGQLSAVFSANARAFAVNKHETPEDAALDSVDTGTLLAENLAIRDYAFASADRYAGTSKAVTHALHSKTVHSAASSLGILPEKTARGSALSLTAASEKIHYYGIDGSPAVSTGAPGKRKKRAATQRSDTGAASASSTPGDAPPPLSNGPATLLNDITDIKATSGPMYGRAHVEGQTPVPYAQVGHDAPYIPASPTGSRSQTMSPNTRFATEHVDPLVTLVRHTLTLNPRHVADQTVARVLPAGASLASAESEGFSTAQQKTAVSDLERISALVSSPSAGYHVPVAPENGGTHRKRQPRSVVLIDDPVSKMIIATPFGDDVDNATGAKDVAGSRAAVAAGGDNNDDDDAMDVDTPAADDAAATDAPADKHRSAKSPAAKRKAVATSDAVTYIKVNDRLVVPRKVKQSGGGGAGASRAHKRLRASDPGGSTPQPQPAASSSTTNDSGFYDPAAPIVVTPGEATRAELSVFTRHKLVEDPAMVVNPAVYEFLSTVVNKRLQNPHKTGDSPQFGRFIAEVQGQAAQISKSDQSSGYNDRTNERSLACEFTKVARAAFQTEDAEAAQSLARVSGISVSDAKRVARSMHPQVSLGLDVKRIMEQFRGYVEDDMSTFMQACFDRDLVERAKVEAAETGKSTALTGGIDTTVLKYRFSDEPSRMHEDYVATVAEISKRESAIFFDLLSRQEARLVQRGQPCYTNRDQVLRDGISEQHQRKVEVVNREYLKQWYCSYFVDEVVNEQKWFFCGNGSTCACREIAQRSKVYGMLYGASAHQDYAGGAGVFVNGHSSKTSAFGTTAVPGVGDLPTQFKRRTLGKSAFNGSAARSSPRETAAILFHPQVLQEKSDDQLRRDVEAVLSGTKEWNLSKGFVGVQFLTPDELAQFDKWKQSGCEGPDPRASVNPLCLLCYIRQVNVQHFQHLHQTTQTPNIHPHTREWMPLNRFQVPHHAYADQALLDSSSGWNAAGSSRFGDGRHLVVGPFPRYRTDFFALEAYVDSGVPAMVPVSRSDSDTAASLLVNSRQRLRIKEQHMDFCHS